jgi:hypothetical protein
MDISLKKYKTHCKLFNAMTIEQLKELYDDDDFMYDVNNETNNMHQSLMFYLPQRLFEEIETLNKVKITEIRQISNVTQLEL